MNLRCNNGHLGDTIKRNIDYISVHIRRHPTVKGVWPSSHSRQCVRWLHQPRQCVCWLHQTRQCVCWLHQPQQCVCCMFAGYTSHDSVCTGYTSHGSVCDGYTSQDSVFAGYTSHGSVCWVCAGYTCHDSVCAGYTSHDSVFAGYTSRWTTDNEWRGCHWRSSLILASSHSQPANGHHRHIDRTAAATTRARV